MKFRVLFLLGAVFWLGLPGLFGQQPREATGQEVLELREQVRSFLRVWLLEKEIDGATPFFSQRAFDNPGLLGASCVGILPANQDVTPKVRFEGVVQFLNAIHREFHWTGVRDIEAILSTDRFKGVEEDLEGAKVVNDWATDRFLLATLSQESVKGLLTEDVSREDELQFMLRQLESSPLYLNVVVVKESSSEAGILLVWKQEGNTWKIIHMDMICQ